MRIRLAALGGLGTDQPLPGSASAIAQSNAVTAEQRPPATFEAGLREWQNPRQAVSLLTTAVTNFGAMQPPIPWAYLGGLAAIPLGLILVLTSRR